MVLFDIMTHSKDGNTGIGDFGQDGIKSFLQDHTCGKICQGLGLHEKQLEKDEGSDDSENEHSHQGDHDDEEEGEIRDDD
ncbi:hypothetical protein BDN70DRAFT_939932 [Pholiota conissans]|uniref:Alpha-type protein kinase domain-containing protein n=1 Tax=Pholiota conissans TaxID=109636 RepID=A0A9P5YLV5_9AGAR|nr:hypothetical protein BDN70DRAFT_939932 [Pholiota conissans]